MTRKRFHGLKKVKVRASWNKYNLYNLTRLRAPPTHRNHYQEKWTAKSMSRAYHGEYIREKQWQRMFRSRIPAVVPMDHRYLAENDGSELAAGRGSGREKPLNSEPAKSAKNQIPFMHMTYAPLERRLDMAVWRALFASSARQARQFVTHGMVKVNGQKMPYAGYLLNPGDMFQVEVDRVLYATGAPKTPEQIRKGRKIHRAQRLANQKASEKRLARKRDVAAGRTNLASTGSQLGIDEIRKQRKLDLKALQNQAETILHDKRSRVGAKRKIQIRAFMREVKDTMKTVNRRSEKELDAELASLVSKLETIRNHAADAAAEKAEKEESESQKEELSPEEQKKLREALVLSRENPVDESKPYATPWRPRPFMSAFAFIPRYLEVNHNICAAVYLRHPVARPGFAEVPSPFPAEIQQLAYTWYLRRR